MIKEFLIGADKIIEKNMSLFVLLVAVAWLVAGILVGAVFFCECGCVTALDFSMNLKEVCANPWLV